MIATEMPWRQRPQGAQYRGDRMPSHGENGADQQRQNSLECRLGKCYRKLHDKRLRRRWKSKHNGLLSDKLALLTNNNRQESFSFCINFSSIRNL